LFPSDFISVAPQIQPESIHGLSEACPYGVAVVIVLTHGCIRMAIPTGSE
jgi:hypothetical protein